MNKFYNILLNTLISNVTNSFLWFALTFWAYLETRSVIATAFIGGSFMIMNSISGLFFGTLVDNHKKHTMMLLSSLISLITFALAGMMYLIFPDQTVAQLNSPGFWIFALLILLGGVAGNIRGIALSTLVTILVDKNRRDKANGLVGTVNGIAFAITSVFSGLVIGSLGMGWALGISIILTFLTVGHLLTIKIDEKITPTKKGEKKTMDLSGTILAIRSVPGLTGLIVFTMFNNLLGGVFMALMDAYGLSLVSVEIWGILWGGLSFGFIFGGLMIAKVGLSSKPLRTLLIANVFMWVISIFFTIRASIILTSIGMFLYMCLIPIVEAVEQTIVQRLVPLARQGRVFGFAHSLESAASPVTAFMIGPIAEMFFIPFMESGEGKEIFGWLVGSGPSRGIAMVFITAGVLGLIATVIARFSNTYKILSEAYTNRE